MKNIYLLLLATALVGCARVPVIKPTPVCRMPESMMQECRAPVVLSDGVTYEQLLQRYQEDRQQFVLCATQHKNLRDTVQECTERLEAYNREIANPQAGKYG